MKKILSFLILTFLVQNTFSAITYERVLTEDSSIQTALSINHDILIQAQNVELAKQRIKESKSLYFPNIEFNLNVSKFNNAEPMVIMGGLTPSPIFFPAENKNVFFSTRLSVWQHIYAGGRIRTTNKLANINMSKVKNEENLAKIKVINKVKNAFNNCLYYKEKLNLYKADLAKAATSKKTELNSKIEIAQFNFDKEVLNLLSTIGLELNTIIDVSGNIKPKVKNIDLNQCLLLAYQYKPELQMTQQQESMDGLLVNLHALQRYPTISVGAAQEWLGDKIVGDDNSWYVAINANIPIFDGGGAIARAKQGKITVREATLNRSKTEDVIRLQVNTAFLEYNFWKKQAEKLNLIDKSSYNEDELEVVYNLNKSYFALEFAIGVQLDTIN